MTKTDNANHQSTTFSTKASFRKNWKSSDKQNYEESSLKGFSNIYEKLYMAIWAAQTFSTDDIEKYSNIIVNL